MRHDTAWFEQKHVLIEQVYVRLYMNVLKTVSP